MKSVIFGAQGMALGVYNSIKKTVPTHEISCFLVTEIGMNATSLCGIPVKELKKFAQECSDADKETIRVLIATPENVMEEIEQSLEQYKFYKHVRIDSKRWSEMQKNIFILDDRFKSLSAYPVGFSESKIYIYKAKFYKDKKLQTYVTNPNYVIPMQVGAGNTDVRVADVLDSAGENISERNGNYSELTGLYWIWKNRIQKKYYGDGCYYGLAHYRRLFELTEDDLLRLTDNDIDVVLPYPMPYEPNIEEHHKRYLSKTEWNAVLQALEELQPEYAKAFEEILKQQYFYNYNIIIAKSDILDSYCRWLFPILFKIEELNDPNKDKKPNRYIGYIGETLETLYFMHNSNKLRIAHTGYKFLI